MVRAAPALSWGSRLMQTLTAGLTTATLILAMACRSHPENEDSTAVVVALPLGASSSGELTAEQEYRDRADEYAEERTALSEVENGRAIREPGILRILPRSGEAVTLRDSIAPGDDYIRYVYAAHHPKLGVHVVRVLYYEGESALLIADSTGRRTHVDNLPLVAPDSAHFAVVSFDLEAGYAPNLLEIWRPAADTMVREFAQDFGSAVGPDSAVWRSGDTLSFVRTRYLTGGDYERTPGRLVGREGVWRIEPPIP